MPVHFNYQGHVGTDPRTRPKSLNVPSRVNAVISGAGNFLLNLDRALSDTNREEYEQFRDRVRAIESEAIALVNTHKDVGMEHAQRP